MKIIKSLLTTCLLINLLSCGGSSEQDGFASGEFNDLDFAGEYVFREHNCQSRLPFNRIRVSLNGNLVTALVVDPGQAAPQINAGDRIGGLLQDGNVGKYADFDSIFCKGFVVTQEYLEAVQNLTLINFREGDLGFLCYDISVDEECEGAYTRL